ncbi:hypothetical protein [Clostridium phage vB_CpeP_PMQ04]|nr:hypothetical protein [Clostridium phage vB_CpeP_PMQ04]
MMMERSNTYVMLKKQIEGGRYEKEEILIRLDVFLARKRITPEQYVELVNMVEDGVGK